MHGAGERLNARGRFHGGWTWNPIRPIVKRCVARPEGAVFSTISGSVLDGDALDIASFDRAEHGGRDQ
jgi:hypothetical protein